MTNCPLPERIYLDGEVAGHQTARELMRCLPEIPVCRVEGETHPGNGWLVTRNRGSFIRRCPGMKGSVCCDLLVSEWILGCPYRCEYCALQTYLKPGDITFYVDRERIRGEIDRLVTRQRRPIRLCTGEFGDSLATEHLYPVVQDLAASAVRYPQITVEIKTKSARVEPLLELPRSLRLVVGFSINPGVVIERYEHETARFPERLAAIDTVLGRGFRVAIHFDPILRVKGWRDLYAETVKELACSIAPGRIAWVSLGTFRHPAGMEDVVLANYPETDLFRSERVRSADGKMRYIRPVREEMLRFVADRVAEWVGREAIYLCMESADLWERAMGREMNTSQLACQLDGRV